MHFGWNLFTNYFHQIDDNVCKHLIRSFSYTIRYCTLSACSIKKNCLMENVCCKGFAVTLFSTQIKYPWKSAQIYVHNILKIISLSGQKKCIVRNINTIYDICLDVIERKPNRVYSQFYAQIDRLENGKSSETNGKIN